MAKENQIPVAKRFDNKAHEVHEILEQIKDNQLHNVMTLNPNQLRDKKIRKAHKKAQKAVRKYAELLEKKNKKLIAKNQPILKEAEIQA